MPKFFFGSASCPPSAQSTIISSPNGLLIFPKYQPTPCWFRSSLYSSLSTCLCGGFCLWRVSIVYRFFGCGVGFVLVPRTRMCPTPRLAQFFEVETNTTVLSDRKFLLRIFCANQITMASNNSNNLNYLAWQSTDRDIAL